MAQSERRIRIIKAGGESLGLKQHAFGHVAPPALHRGAKYPKGQVALRQMRGYGEAIRTRSDDDSIYHTSVLARKCILLNSLWTSPRAGSTTICAWSNCSIFLQTRAVRQVEGASWTGIPSQKF